MAKSGVRSGHEQPLEELRLRPEDRLLVVAAHPDDDVIAAGGLLQRALSAGTAIDVAFATDGENNPWAQRASEHRFLVSAADRPRFGARRRAEALAALAQLGVDGARVRFLGLPDQTLTRLLVEAPAQTVGRLRAMLQARQPSVVVGPSAADLHPDHSALAVLLRLALAGHTDATGPQELAYVVHNPALRHHPTAAFRLALGESEQRRKREAILCHATQLHLRGPWLRSFAAGAEEFAAVPWPVSAPHPVSAVRSSPAGDLVATVSTHPRIRSYGARTLLLLAESEAGGLRSFSCSLPAWSREVPVFASAATSVVAHGRFAGSALAGELHLPADLLAGCRRVFLKLERRFGFFDEAGWQELSLPPTHPGNRQ